MNAAGDHPNAWTSLRARDSTHAVAVPTSDDGCRGTHSWTRRN